MTDIEREFPKPSSIANLVGARPTLVERVRAGRSGTRKYVISTQNERFFLKSANQSDKRAARLLQREGNILAQLPSHPQLPTLIRYVETGETVHIVTSYIRGSSPRKWNGDTSEIAFGAVLDLYAELSNLSVTAPHIEERPGRFNAFGRAEAVPRMTHLPKRQRTFLRDNRDRLRMLESTGQSRVCASSLIHCDLAVDNMIFRSSGEVCLVDWAHAHLGNQLYDLAAMLIRIRADSAWTPRLESVLSRRIQGELEAWVPMVVLATGIFLQTSLGERERPTQSLSAERLRYSIAAVGWLMDLL